MFPPFSCSDRTLLFTAASFSCFLFVHVGLGSSDWLGYWRISNFFTLRNYQVAFAMIWIIIHLYCEALSDLFYSIWLNLSREILLSTVTSSINSSNLVPLTGFNAHAITLAPTSMENNVLCFISLTPSLLIHMFLLPLLQVHLGLICPENFYKTVQAF